MSQEVSPSQRPRNLTDMVAAALGQNTPAATPSATQNLPLFALLAETEAPTDTLAVNQSGVAAPAALTETVGETDITPTLIGYARGSFRAEKMTANYSLAD